MSAGATASHLKDVPIVEGIAALADDFDGYILDLWGVLHNGVWAFPDALDCLTRLRRLGKQVVILSNAPRRADSVAARCHELGILPEHYDGLMSSGEEAWRHLRHRPDDWYRDLGERCYHLGPDRDHGMREGLDYHFVDDLAAAEFVLNTGALDHTDTAETYAALLEEMRARGLPMVCANPDLVVIRGERMEICAGTIADSYAEMGGDVRYHGKPHAGVYRESMALFDGLPPDRILAVGDSLRTDVAGAAEAGIQSVFVVSGIHSEDLAPDEGQIDPARLAALCAERQTWPLAATFTFSW